MKIASKLRINKVSDATGSVEKVLWTVLLAVGTLASAYGQGQIASGTISGSGSGPYSYSLSFSDAAGATSSIGSVWYAWTPGLFYLPSMPISASAPAGWSATISGDSVQFVASGPANYIAPGQSLSGFGYSANFSPALLASTPNSGVSVAYSAGLFSDLGNTFTVQTVPEPAALTLLLGGVLGLGLLRQRKA
jgi:hypothetical protein